MQKQITEFKSVVNDVESIFQFQTGCSTAVAKEALFQCLKWVGAAEDAANAAQKAVQQVKEPLPEEVTTEPMES